MLASRGCAALTDYLPVPSLPVPTNLDAGDLCPGSGFDLVVNPSVAAGGAVASRCRAGDAVALWGPGLLLTVACAGAVWRGSSTVCAGAVWRGSSTVCAGVVWRGVSTAGSACGPLSAGVSWMLGRRFAGHRAAINNARASNNLCTVCFLLSCSGAVAGALGGGRYGRAPTLAAGGACCLSWWMAGRMETPAKHARAITRAIIS